MYPFSIGQFRNIHKKMNNYFNQGKTPKPNNDHIDEQKKITF